jgi:hypothetical protein
LKPSAKPITPPSSPAEEQIEQPPVSPVIQSEQPKPEVNVEDSDCDEEDDHHSVSSSVKDDPQTTSVPVTEPVKKGRKVVKKKE